MRQLRTTLKAPPQQARSQETLERVLAATERLLEQRHFEDLSIGQILKKSGVSVGSFYARFRSKEDLLPLLYQSYSQDMRRRMADWLAPARWQGKHLVERTCELLGLAVANYRDRRGLLRAVALLARSRPALVARTALDERAEQYEAAVALLLECRDEIRHPDPALAVRTGILFTLAACRDKILFAEAPHPASVPLTDAQLADEMSRALCAYLTTRPAF